MKQPQIMSMGELRQRIIERLEHLRHQARWLDKEKDKVRWYRVQTELNAVERRLELINHRISTR